MRYIVPRSVPSTLAEQISRAKGQMELHQPHETPRIAQREDLERAASESSALAPSRTVSTLSSFTVPDDENTRHYSSGIDQHADALRLPSPDPQASRAVEHLGVPSYAHRGSAADTAPPSIENHSVDDNELPDNKHAVEENIVSMVSLTGSGPIHAA